LNLDPRSWQGIRELVLQRIDEGTWQSGQLIPGETSLAEELGCARATVNRALRQLADEGFLDRRRKAGTRVAVNRVQKATLNIPVIREEVENSGGTYSHIVIHQFMGRPPKDTDEGVWSAGLPELLHLQSLHLCDGNPHMYEDRWINTAAVPKILNVDFSTISANEWLVQNTPVTDGEISFSAINLPAFEARQLKTKTASAAFVIERNTRNRQGPITKVRQFFAPGHRMQTAYKRFL